MGKDTKNEFDFPIRLVGRDGDEHARFVVSRPEPNTVQVYQGIVSGCPARVSIEVADVGLVVRALLEMAEVEA